MIPLKPRYLTILILGLALFVVIVINLTFNKPLLSSIPSVIAVFLGWKIIESIKKRKN